MLPLPKKAKAKARLFNEDNNWLVREAERRHTIVAVIINELIGSEKEMRKIAQVQRNQFASINDES